MAAYTTRLLTSPQDLAAIAETWNALRRREVRPALQLHPDWLVLETRAKTDTRLAVIALYDGAELVGVAPFLLRPWRWKCRFAYANVVSFPVRLADLCGETLLVPDDPAAYDAIFSALVGVDLPYDMVLLEALPTQSRLWQAVRESPIVHRALWVYAPKGPGPHWFIRLPPDFEAYLAKFSGKRRRKLQHAIRHLEHEAKESIRVERVTEPAQVPAFLEHVERVSSRSWQGKRLQQVVQAAGAERIHLTAQAERGWLRSYLLMCGAQCLAFVIGAQLDGVYYYERIGYDPDWTSYSVGSVLLYRIIEDLYAHQRPNWFDFGTGDAEYKRSYGNESLEEVNAFLLRRSPYMGLARTVHGSLAAFEDVLRRSVNRSGIRSRVLRFLRRGGAASAGTSAETSATPSASDNRHETGSVR